MVKRCWDWLISPAPRRLSVLAVLLVSSLNIAIGAFVGAFAQQWMANANSSSSLGHHAVVFSAGSNTKWLARIVIRNYGPATSQNLTVNFNHSPVMVPKSCKVVDKFDATFSGRNLAVAKISDCKQGFYEFEKVLPGYEVIIEFEYELNAEVGRLVKLAHADSVPAERLFGFTVVCSGSCNQIVVPLAMR